MIVKALDFLTFRLGLAEVSGTGRDGKPDIRFHVARVAPGGLCLPPDPVAVITAGRGKEAALTGAALRLAECILPAATASEAALAGLSVRGAAVWHAEQDTGGHWRPVRASGGMMHDPFDARFRDSAEAAALWTDRPDAVPLFTIRTDHGIRRAFVWQDRALYEIATQIFTMKG